MRFTLDGQNHDTDGMRRIDTGLPGIPCIYISDADQTVFVAIVSNPHGLQMRRATADEIRWLAEILEMPDLLALLPPPC